ncbi:hypothetical protein Tco_0882683 [Tanacetum coccineum]
MSTQEYMKKAVENEDFKSGTWVSDSDYVNVNGGTSCSPNVIGDLTVTMKDLSGTIPGTIHHKVIGDGGYGKDITVRLCGAKASQRREAWPPRYELTKASNLGVARDGARKGELRREA